MARKGKRSTVDEVLRDLQRDGLKVTCGMLNADYFKSVVEDAVYYLDEYRNAQCAGEVADLDVGEIGAIIRRQRQRIAFLEREMKATDDANLSLRLRISELERRFDESGES